VNLSQRSVLAAALLSQLADNFLQPLVWFTDNLFAVSFPLFVLPFTLLVVLASSTSGDQHFCETVTLC
jgi:hypothetical protein